MHKSLVAPALPAFPYSHTSYSGVCTLLPLTVFRITADLWEGAGFAPKLAEGGALGCKLGFALSIITHAAGCTLFPYTLQGRAQSIQSFPNLTGRDKLQQTIRGIPGNPSGLCLTVFISVFNVFYIPEKLAGPAGEWSWSPPRPRLVVPAGDVAGHQGTKLQCPAATLHHTTM